MSDDAIQLSPAEGYKGDEALRSVLLDSVAHQLKTPLTSIKVSVTALQATPNLQPRERDELLFIIDEEVDRLKDLVEEALKTAQLVGVQLDLKSHAIEEIIHAATDYCKTRLGQRSVSVQLKPGLRPVLADLNRIKIALAELLENATKYSPAEQPIIITGELSGEFVITSVVDRGSGINESEQASIFEKAYRGADHRYAARGTGMGLPIANAIIRAHGGSLIVTSRPGHGSVFSFLLPVY